MVTLTQNDKLISRIEAASRLQISIRTLDRYIQKKILSTKSRNRKIWLYEKEIESLAEEQKNLSDESKENFFHSSFQFDPTQKEPSSSDSSLVTESSIINMDSRREATIYRELYFDLKDEFRDSQKRLETANYRVGQLETQLQNTVPLIELTKKSQETEKKELELQEKVQREEQKIEFLTHALNQEKSHKWIYLLLLSALILIEPLLLLLDSFWQ